MTNYLYIFEDGSMKQSKGTPSDTDWECVSDGYLIIVEASEDGFYEYQGDGSREPVEDAE